MIRERHTAFVRTAAAALLLVASEAYAMTTRTVELQGHRGARGHVAENTLAGFAHAVSTGVDTLELDVGMTRDGVVVIHHDRALNPEITRDPSGRWIDAPIPLVSLDFADLAVYDVGRIDPGSRYAKRFPHQQGRDGVRIPSLDELFRWSARNALERLRFNIEVKVHPEHPAETATPEAMTRALLAVVDAHELRARVTVQSFDWRVQRTLQPIAPDVATAYLSSQQRWDTIEAGQPGVSPWTAGLDVDDHAGSVPRLVAAAGGTIWSPHHGDVTEQRLAEAREVGVRVVVWTVNEPDEIERVLDLGVDGIISDYPDRVRSAMSARGLALPAPRAVTP